MVLIRAAAAAGLDATDAIPLRVGAHATFRLPGEVVARIGEPGSRPIAERELRISAWLNRSGVPTVEAADLDQPIVIDHRPITWWRFIPEHRTATPAELATALRRLHALPPSTTLELPAHDPFAEIREHIDRSTAIPSEDRAWLLRHEQDLRQRYVRLPLPERPSVIHGDAWQGNVIVPPYGTPILLDLATVALGRPEWDLIPIAVDHTDFDRLTFADYRAFVDAYGGYDLTRAADFRIFADIQELRWTAFAIGLADRREDARVESAHRIACLRERVPKPWSWKAL